LTSRNVGGMLHDSVISRDVLCHRIVNVPLLIATAPTQNEPPFAVAQILVLAMFILLGRAAVKGFRQPA